MVKLTFTSNQLKLVTQATVYMNLISRETLGLTEKDSHDLSDLHNVLIELTDKLNIIV